jgi:hypothetical protein
LIGASTPLANFAASSSTDSTGIGIHGLVVRQRIDLVEADEVLDREPHLLEGRVIVSHGNAPGWTLCFAAILPFQGVRRHA